jgi:oligopeptidase B
MKPAPIPPAALRGDKSPATTQPGMAVPYDPYRWLREKNNPAAIEYLNAENRYTESIMQPTEGLQEKLYQEILGRVKETDLGLPTYHGGYFYYTRTEKGKQYAIYCRKQASLDAPEQVLLDANELAAGQNYFRIGVYQPSPDHQLLAYSTDVEGDEVYTVRIKDLRTGQLLPDIVTGTGAALEWANDNRTFFYTTLDSAKRPDRVYRYQLGLGNSRAVEVYHEADERFNVDLAKSKSQAYLFLDINSHVTSEYRYLSAADAEGVFQVLLPRRQEVEYSVAHHNAHFYIRINDTGKNFRLVKTPVGAPSAANFVEIGAHRDDVFMEAVDAFRDHLVLVERDRGLRTVAIEHMATGARHRIAFEEPVYTAGLGANPEFESNILRFTYTSLVTPASVFDYDMDRRTRELKKQTEVLGGYDPKQYVSERVFATAPDGVPVPVSLVYKSGLLRDGQAPALLYGYGAYGHSSDPGFVSDRLSLLDRGFVYAIAHIRGGSEMGRPWYDDGKLLRKKNSFTDFVACAEYLIGNGYTSNSRLAVLGGSAGGLLIGAVLNLRPDLFHAAVAKVPFVDVLNTMLDASLPLTIAEYEEWGNPNAAQYHEYIRSYSPYDNVEPKIYPTLLITAGLNDPRVSYWEPAKWAAKLRAAKRGDQLLLLKTNMGAGHFGASGRYERFKETAFDYAFLLKALGMEE